MYFHKWNFHKAVWQQNISTDNTRHSKHLHFRKMSQLVHSSSSPTVPHSNCRAGRSSRLTWRSGQWAGGSVGFSSLRALYPPGKPEAPKMSYMFFSSNTGTNSVLKTAFQILWSLQWITQAEGAPPLAGEVPRQGYPGSLGSGSRGLL